MNAKEAREIAVNLNIQSIQDMAEVLRAEGYLSALEGPEVKALIEAFEKIARGSEKEKGGMHVRESPFKRDDLRKIAVEAVSLFREAVKP